MVIVMFGAAGIGLKKDAGRNRADGGGSIARGRLPKTETMHIAEARRRTKERTDAVVAAVREGVDGKSDSLHNKIEKVRINLGLLAGAAESVLDIALLLNNEPRDAVAREAIAVALNPLGLASGGCREQLEGHIGIGSSISQKLVQLVRHYDAGTKPSAGAEIIFSASTSPDELVSHPAEPAINKLRAKVDALDAELVGLLAERCSVVGEIAREKVKGGICLVDVEREREMLASVSEMARAHGLDAEHARKAFTEVLRLSKKQMMKELERPVPRPYSSE
jgi:chorismate mutase